MAETVQHLALPTSTPTTTATTTTTRGPLLRSCSAEAAAAQGMHTSARNMRDVMNGLASALALAVPAPLRSLAAPLLPLAGSLPTAAMAASAPPQTAAQPVASAEPARPAAPALPPLPRTCEGQDVIVVVYRSAWDAHMHASLDQQPWTELPGFPTVECPLPAYEGCRVAAVPATSARFAFNDGGAAWDNNQGRDYTIEGPGVYLLDCGVITRLDTATGDAAVAAVICFNTHEGFSSLAEDLSAETIPLDVYALASGALRAHTNIARVALVPGTAESVGFFDCNISPALAQFALAGPGMYVHAPHQQSQCELCMLPGLHFEMVGTDSQVEQWQKTTLCDHTACHSCLRGWVGAQVREGRLTVRCPIPDCAFVLYAEDIKRHVSEADYERFLANCAAVHERRRAEIVRDPAMAAYLEEYGVTFCPRCNVLIERYEGCDAMVCTCGFDFCIVCKESLDHCSCNVY